MATSSESFGKYRYPTRIYIRRPEEKLYRLITMGDEDSYEVFVQQVQAVYPELPKDFVIVKKGLGTPIRPEEFFHLVYDNCELVLYKSGEVVGSLGKSEEPTTCDICILL